jgi:hypothetical protein
LRADLALKSRAKRLQRKCREVRLRAERKWGELYAASEKAKGSPGNQYTGPLGRDEGPKTLADTGVSYDQSSQWQKLAAVSDESFEVGLNAPSRQPLLHA